MWSEFGAAAASASFVGGAGENLATLDTMTRSARTYSSDERRLIARLRTPSAIERWLRTLEYNREVDGETLRSFRAVLQDGAAHCLEGALAAAAIMETRGYPPLLLDIESRDLIDHVVYVYRTRTGWGSIGTSKYPGLKGRRPLFASVRALALSYADPFFDYTGYVKGFGVLDLRDLPVHADWRFSPRNVWTVQKTLIAMPHTRGLRHARTRERRWRKFYLAFKREHPTLEPPASAYPGHERWV
jgi:hypothetical protein